MSKGSRLYSEMSGCPLCPRKAVCTVRCLYVPYAPGTRLYSRMSICPLCPWEAVRTVRCPFVLLYPKEAVSPYVPCVPRTVRTVRCPYVPLSLKGHRGHTDISLYEQFWGHGGHTDISLYEWSRGHRGQHTSRRTSMTNGFQLYIYIEEIILAVVPTHQRGTYSNVFCNPSVSYPPISELLAMLTLGGTV